MPLDQYGINTPFDMTPEDAVAGYGVGGPVTGVTPAGGGMGAALPAITAGAGILQGIAGKNAQDRATQAQSRAQAQAFALQERQLRDQEAQQNYANTQAQAARNRSTLMRNAFLRSMGATGMTDPTVNWDAFNAAPPVIGGPLQPSDYQTTYPQVRPPGAPPVAAPVVPPRPPVGPPPGAYSLAAIGGAPGIVNPRLVPPPPAPPPGAAAGGPPPNSLYGLYGPR